MLHADEQNPLPVIRDLSVLSPMSVNLGLFRPLECGRGSLGERLWASTMASLKHHYAVQLESPSKTSRS
jgi:hypothetical protein